VRRQGGTDIALDDLIVTQAVNDQPLILNKDTVVRAVVSTTATGPLQARVVVDFEGRTFEETGTLEDGKGTIDVFVGAPTRLQSQTISARVEVIGEMTDADPTDNSRSVTLPVVRPEEDIVAFFLPVDWTEDQRRRYNFDTEFPRFVRENAAYLEGAYPLGQDQITVDYTLSPHMLAANEKRLATNQGESDMISSHLLYATISLAARRLKPDATLVVGVFPPGWFAAHGKKSTLGLALGDVNGTVTAQYVLTDATTSAHELAHLYWMYEDYDFAVEPTRPFTWIDRSGYYVQQQEPKDIDGGNQIPTFLSAYSPERPSWVDSRIYEYLTAKFTVGRDGRVSEPLVLAATISRQVEPEGLPIPSDYAAGYQRFEPEQTVYISIALAGMGGGERLEVRWFHGDRQVLTDQDVVNPGDGWYAFSMRNRRGLPEGEYRVETFLDGGLVKSSRFQVKSSE
jgi:hypothetical protein